MSAVDLASLRFDGLISREWLATNGNGSYASSTLAGLNTRKYHGLLVAAMAPPVRRLILLSRVEESVICRGKRYELASSEYPGTIHPQGHQFLRAFNPIPFPRWAYQSDGWTVEKQLRPLKGENTTLLTYTLLGSAGAVEFELKPLFALRPIHELMHQFHASLDPVDLHRQHHRIPATPRTPEIFFAHSGAFAPQPCWYLNTVYRRERERGYDDREDLWMPGTIRFTLLPGQSVHFACSTEPIDLARVLVEAERQYDRAVLPAPTHQADEDLESLLRAAEQFVVHGRDNTPHVMASYPWASPSGRDALICLPGLLLVTGRIDDAGNLLASFAASLKNGLMPSDLAEDGAGARYTAADTSLWFVNAVSQYLRYGGDESFVAGALLKTIQQIIETYRRGTALGITVDADGLIRAAAPGVPVTWMDGVIGDRVVTPRNGYCVALNALWHNAVRIGADLSLRFGQGEAADELDLVARRCRAAFNHRFWNPDTHCLFDVLGDPATGSSTDPAVRPNQLLALSLPNPVLDIPLHEMVLDRVRHDLLTPFGLRTLAPAHCDYRGAYAGNACSRDNALHQGCVFPWLLGPYVTACVRLQGHGEDARRIGRAVLEPCLAHLRDAGTGQLSELFHGDHPHTAGGSPASARSIAELLRAYAEDVLELTPGALPPRTVASTAPDRHSIGHHH